jgi:hypothetical protein
MDGAERQMTRYPGDGASPEPDAADLNDLSDPREELLGRIVERPDGLHWVAPDGHQEFGPYASVEEALAAMSEAADDSPEPGESLAEAEQELGIADWLDPDTGEPAEGAGARIVDQ